MTYPEYDPEDAPGYSDMEPQHEACPFCGGTNLFISADYSEIGRYCVHCNQCDCDGPFVSTESEAWQLWDTRVEPKAAKWKRVKDDPPPTGQTIVWFYRSISGTRTPHSEAVVKTFTRHYPDALWTLLSPLLPTEQAAES